MDLTAAFVLQQIVKLVQSERSISHLRKPELCSFKQQTGCGDRLRVVGRNIYSTAPRRCSRMETTRATVERNPFPIYVQRGEGAYLVDVDGNRLLDLNNNFTTLIHGHGFAPATEACRRPAALGNLFRQTDGA